MGKAHYQLYRDKAECWRWRYVAGNGRVIAVSSEGYINKTDARAVIRSMKRSFVASVKLGTPRKRRK